MKRFLIKAGIILAINILIAAWFLFQAYSKDDHLFFHYTQTESVLGSVPAHTAYDLLIMGSSHGRIFSRSGNHRKVEQLLRLKMANIARSGAGVVPEQAYLEYFYLKGNTTKTIVYFIDPFGLSTERWNERLYFLTDEPFKPIFIPLLFKHGIDADVIYNYIKSKFLKSWQKDHGMIREDATYCLKHRVEESVNKRIAAIYPDGYTEERFDAYLDKLEKVIPYAQSRNCRVIFIIPPTLLGKTPGHDRLVERLKVFQQKYGVKWYDHSMTITNPGMYYNHDHMNVRGVAFFTENYLKPALSAVQ